MRLRLRLWLRLIRIAQSANVSVIFDAQKLAQRKSEGSQLVATYPSLVPSHRIGENGIRTRDAFRFRSYREPRTYQLTLISRTPVEESGSTQHQNGVPGYARKCRQRFSIVFARNGTGRQQIVQSIVQISVRRNYLSSPHPQSAPRNVFGAPNVQRRRIRLTPGQQPIVFGYHHQLKELVSGGRKGVVYSVQAAIESFRPIVVVPHVSRNDYLGFVREPRNRIDSLSDQLQLKAHRSQRIFRVHGRQNQVFSASVPVRRISHVQYQRQYPRRPLLSVTRARQQRQQQQQARQRQPRTSNAHLPKVPYKNWIPGNPEFVEFESLAYLSSSRSREELISSRANGLRTKLCALRKSFYL